MNQKNTTHTVRFVPVAMALVLFFILGLLALTVQAEELSDASLLREEMQSNMEERQALFEEQAEERKVQFEENREEFQMMRSEVASSEARAEFQIEAQEEHSAMFGEHMEERRELFNEQREEVRSTLEEQRSRLKEQLEERKQEREERKAEYRARLNVQQQVHLSEYSENMYSRMTSIVSRLEDIADRAGNRIAKIEEEHGVILSKASASLEDVYVLIELVEENIALFGDSSVDMVTSEDPKTQMAELRETVLLVKESIQAVHEQLQETVENIKASAELFTVDTGKEDSGEDAGVVIEHEYNDGVHTYSGIVVTPTPCYSVETMAIVAESYPEQITIDVTLVNDTEGSVCATVLDEKSFSVDVRASEEAKLVHVRVNGEVVDWVFD